MQGRGKAGRQGQPRKEEPPRQWTEAGRQVSAPDREAQGSGEAPLKGLWLRVSQRQGQMAVSRRRRWNPRQCLQSRAGGGPGRPCTLGDKRGPLPGSCAGTKPKDARLQAQRECNCYETQWNWTPNKTVLQTCSRRMILGRLEDWWERRAVPTRRSGGLRQHVRVRQPVAMGHGQHTAAATSVVRAGNPEQPVGCSHREGTRARELNSRSILKFSNGIWGQGQYWLILCSVGSGVHF